MAQWLNDSMNQFESLLCGKVAQQVHGAGLVLLPGGRAVSQGGPVERAATLAAVNLRGPAKRLDGFLFLGGGRETMWLVVIPTLKVAHAKLSLGVFLVTSPLAGSLLFDFESHAASLAIDSLIHFSIE
jgi:hypothetical protein